MAQQTDTFPVTTQSRLLTLPGEILGEIVTWTMASNEPANLWLFIDVLHDPQRKINRDSHWLDWMFVNGTCRLLKCYGKTAFFREKSFVIPTWCIRALTRVVASNKVSPDLLLAKACIGEIVAPVAGLTINAWQMLPALHFFERLRCLTIELPITRMYDRFYPEFPEQAPEFEQKVPFEAPTSHLVNELNILGVHVPTMTFNWKSSMEINPSPLEFSSLESDAFSTLTLAVARQNPARIEQCYDYVSPLGRLIKIR